MKIVVFHLYNDFSGSPTVLRSVVTGLAKRGHEIELISSRGGILDSITESNVRHVRYNYRFSPNPAVTMLRYGAVQAQTFVKALKYAFEKDTVFYINTILPVGPALAGRLSGKKVIYHYHENAFIKSAFYRALTSAMQRLAHKVICVSEYQKSFLSRSEGVSVVPNANSSTFVSRLKPNPEAAFERKNVLMLGSLKEYKGVDQFVELATKLPEYQFTLVINDEQEAVDKYFKNHNLTIPSNLHLYPRQKDVVDFYNNASLLLNLSDPRSFIETFGMTAIEAMAAGLPVIVPTVGGIAELVTDDVNGYKIDVANIDQIVLKIKEILTNNDLYQRLATNALKLSENYNEESSITQIERIITT